MAAKNATLEEELKALKEKQQPEKKASGPIITRRDAKKVNNEMEDARKAKEDARKAYLSTTRLTTDFGDRWKRQNHELVLWSVSKALEADHDFDFYGDNILEHNLFIIDAVDAVCHVPDLTMEIGTMRQQLAEANDDMLTLITHQERMDRIHHCMSIVQPKLAEYLPEDYYNKLSAVV
eukprot:COSAG06_NODE_16612_length_990_cov_1.852974_1_plen_177_part_10